MNSDKVDEVMKFVSDEVQIKACRSSGPGGQHVNKGNKKS